MSGVSDRADWMFFGFFEVERAGWIVGKLRVQFKYVYFGFDK